MSPAASVDPTADRLAFVVPPLHGPPTGGTRYNRGLIEALRQRGEEPEVLSRARARVWVAEPRARRVWVDSLWMADLPALARAAAPACTVGLLTHYLPSLVRHGSTPARAALTAPERAALEAARAFLVPSAYMARVLVALGVEAARIGVLEPGVELPVAARPAAPVDGAPLRAICVANVTEGKGLRPLLEALAAQARPGDALALAVVGDLQMEPAYARGCAALVEQHAALRERVHLLGPRPYPACIEALQRSDLLVSASRMESFGMALADARAGGRPIVAREGGNVAAHVDPRWGGQLVPDEDHLARALLALARDRAELRERQRRAWAHRPHRPWLEVASALRRVSPP